VRRGAVYALLGAIGAVMAPHAARLPLWLTGLVSACLVWQALGTARGWKPLSRWILAGLSVAATAAVILAFGPVPGREGSVALLVLMAALKCLELRSVRDAQVLTLLGYFLILTHFLYSQSGALALYLATTLLWLLATAAAFQDRNRRLSAPALLRVAGLLAAGALPVALVLFLLFPRVQGPLFGSGHASAGATTGLGDSMSPGDIVDLGLSEEVAFTVDFEGDAINPREMYWRGPVLWDFDGRTWHAADRLGNASSAVPAGAREVRYRVTLEPHRRRWLFALDAPATPPENTTLGGDLLLRAPQPLRARTRYDVRSLLDYEVGLEEPEAVLRRALRLPRDANPRTVQLAGELRAGSAGDAEVVAAALSMFTREPFHYTLSPPALGQDSVDEFMFGTRRGFCEHYASAFAVLMRAAGIPSRVVTGYQGGEHNRIGNYLVVRQSHAHAWTEVWLRGRGWVRIDPTAAVAPSRVETGSSAPWREARGVGADDAFGWFAWLPAGQLLDHARHTWNDWVLDYSPERQRGLLRGIGVEDAAWPRLSALLATALTLVLAALAAMALREQRVGGRDRARRAYARFCDKLERVGCTRLPHEGPFDFARRAIQAHPALSAQVDRITHIYVSLRYGDVSASITELEALVRGFAPRRLVRQSGARY